MTGNSTLHAFKSVLCILITAALIIIAPASAQDAPSATKQFTLQEALAHAYVNNPTLSAARAQLLATHELLPQADAGWKPIVAADAAVTAHDIEGSSFGAGDSGDEDGSTSKSLGLSFNQPLYRGGRTFAQMKASKYLIGSQSELLRAREQEILLATVTSYMDVFRDQSLLDLSISNRDLISRQLEATQIRFDVGEVTKTDVSQAKARMADAESAIIQARGALKTSKAVFEQVTGVPAEGLVTPDIKIPLPGTLDEAVLEAEQNNPLVRSAEAVHRASEEDIEGVFGELLPEVGVVSAWNKTYDPSPGFSDEETSKSIGVAATVPLYEAGATRSRVREAKHTANQRYLEIMEIKREVRQQAVSRWENFQTAQAEIAARKSQVDASAIAREGVAEEAEFGTRTVLDSLDADQEFFDAQTALVTARRDEVVAKFALLQALGALGPETLGFADKRIDLSGNLENVRWKIFDMHVDRLGKGG